VFLAPRTVTPDWIERHRLLLAQLRDEHARYAQRRTDRSLLLSIANRIKEIEVNIDIAQEKLARERKRNAAAARRGGGAAPTAPVSGPGGGVEAEVRSLRAAA